MRKNLLKVLNLFISMLLVVLCTSCNKQIFDLNYTYNKIHIYESGKCYSIESWTDYEGEQIQVKLKDGSVVVISSISCILISGNCPICD